MTEKVRSTSGELFMPQLDGLRAIAVGAVMVHHLLSNDYWPPLVSAMPLGMGGVRLFFVLSGFLITGILLRVRESVATDLGTRMWAMRQFYARRVLRIFPLYYAVIAVLAIVGLTPVREEIWWLVSYLYNFRVASLGWFELNIAHFWSLCVEEQFYLIWPWLVLFVDKRLLKPIAIGMVMLGPLSRSLLIANGYWDTTPYVVTPSCLDALGCGAILAMLTSGGAATRAVVAKLTRSVLPLGLLMVVSLEVFNRTGSWQYRGWLHVIAFDTGLALCFMWLVAAASLGFAGPFGVFLTLRPVTYCGRIAYGLYVFHAVILQSLFTFGVQLGASWQFQGPAFFVVASLCSLILASLSWHYFERPLNELKRFFPYRPPGAPVNSMTPASLVKYTRE